ncbi:MAG: arylesterase [Burkholderiales bacterium]|nr:arylesterase [Burkholderiales bacterium]
MATFLNRRHFSALAVFTAVAGFSSPKGAGAKARTHTILVVGDSLSAEYGIQRGTGWVALMAQRIAAEKLPATVVNASISGDTTSGGRSRLAALLQTHQPTVVVIELGGNDALRGLPLQMTQDNLQAMTRAAQATGAQVLLLGMEVPPNYGQDYAQRFGATLCHGGARHPRQTGAVFVENVADGPDATRLFQSDRIHPLEAAHPIILNNVWPTLKKMIA